MVRTAAKAETIKGHMIPPPKLTVWAFLLGGLYFALPFLAVMLLLDVVFYAIFRYGFDSCYGILCAL